MQATLCGVEAHEVSGHSTGIGLAEMGPFDELEDEDEEEGRSGNGEAGGGTALLIVGERCTSSRASSKPSTSEWSSPTKERLCPLDGRKPSRTLV